MKVKKRKKKAFRWYHSDAYALHTEKKAKEGVREKDCQDKRKGRLMIACDANTSPIDALIIFEQQICYDWIREVRDDRLFREGCCLADEGLIPNGGGIRFQREASDSKRETSDSKERSEEKHPIPKGKHRILKRRVRFQEQKRMFSKSEVSDSRKRSI
ncbi:hypothetical protein DINM_000802 [Dirofilaria immitis]|nr:hypothetical protein [Dirofilaria immitis]